MGEKTYKLTASQIRRLISKAGIPNINRFTSLYTEKQRKKFEVILIEIERRNRSLHEYIQENEAFIEKSAPNKYFIGDFQEKSQLFLSSSQKLLNTIQKIKKAMKRV